MRILAVVMLMCMVGCAKQQERTYTCTGQDHKWGNLWKGESPYAIQPGNVLQTEECELCSKALVVVMGFDGHPMTNIIVITYE